MPVPREGGGGDGGAVGMTPGCVAVSGRRLLPCPSLDPSPSVGGGAHRPLTPSCPPSPCLATPFLSLGRLCQRSPRTAPVSLLRVGYTRRRATDLAVGHVRLTRRWGTPPQQRWGGGGCPRSDASLPLVIPTSRHSMAQFWSERGGGDCGLGGSNAIAKSLREICPKLQENCGKIAGKLRRRKQPSLILKVH